MADKVLTLRLVPELYEDMKLAADVLGMSVTEFVRDAISEHVEQRHPQVRNFLGNNDLDLADWCGGTLVALGQGFWKMHIPAADGSVIEVMPGDCISQRRGEIEIQRSACVVERRGGR